jgi:F0F1-type ATP synthase membrane subunit b/b'
VSVKDYQAWLEQRKTDIKTAETDAAQQRKQLDTSNAATTNP